VPEIHQQTKQRSKSYGVFILPWSSILENGKVIEEKKKKRRVGDNTNLEEEAKGYGLSFKIG
jgi:hypothetical protein